MGARVTGVLAHGAAMEFELDGPAYRLMQRVGLIKGAGPSIGRRIVGFLLLTWIPVLVFSLLEGRALGPTPRESFLLDFATYARFFLAVSLLFVAEVVVGPRLRSAALHFVQVAFVRSEDLPAVETAIVRARRRREALLPELLMLGLALVGAWNSLETWTLGTATWSSATVKGGAGLSLAGLWYHFVGVPILQFFGLRWLWRLLIWTFFLADMARLKLRLVATHPDRAGGLGSLGTAHASLGIFAFGFSSVLSGRAVFQIHLEAAPIESFKTLFAVYLVVMELICVGPLLIFVPLLAPARREGLRRYSILADTYNRAFEQKWVAGQAPPDEPPSGAPTSNRWPTWRTALL